MASNAATPTVATTAHPPLIRDYSLSAVLPLYNEIECLPGALETIYRFLRETFADFEIVVVESGSTDGSGEACEAFARANDGVVVIHEGARNGAGMALRKGFEAATKDLIWILWADLPFPLDIIHAAVPLLRTHDCVLSYRSRDHRDPCRLLLSVVYNNLAKWTLGLEVRHINSTFKVFHRRVVQSMELTSRAWGIEAEIAFRLRRAGARYAEIPVPLIDRTKGTSSVTLWTAVEEYGEVLRLALAERLGLRLARR